MIIAALADRAIFAIWMPGTETPAERLLRNVGNYVKRNPRDAQGYYLLGRLHSLLFANETRTIAVYEQKPNGLPALPAYESVIVKRTGKGELTKTAGNHLLESIRNYRRATELAPNQPMAFLGLGWMLESGAAWAARLGAPPGEKKTGSEAWKESALAAYRKAYSLSVAGDLKREGLGPGADPAISLEAGQGILRILAPRKASSQEMDEAIKIRETISKLESKPRAVTPIIFSLERAASLDDLLAADRLVRFDLAGDGKPGLWPWVKPETAILVWDPKRAGRIESGLQLFGSATWWMAWRHGYQPLAALDDNQDCWLSGKELDGLSVWRDRNGNAISESGEVSPVQSLGISALAVTGTADQSGLYFNPRGIRLDNGTFLPTYDWTPVEVKTLADMFSSVARPGGTTISSCSKFVPQSVPGKTLLSLCIHSRLNNPIIFY
ncbi:MAG: hypothetical protein ACREEM_38280 [Blastocatellia bacterium]